MKAITLWAIALLITTSACFAQEASQATIDKWFASNEYLGGLTLKPYAGVNKAELYKQYQKNKALWDAAFAYLKNTNLDTLSLVKKRQIIGDDLFISVTENPTKDFDNTKWEFHKKYIDIQYVIKGKEKMGALPVEKLNVTEPYTESRDGGNGTSTEGSYYVAEPGTFMVFFPSDAHRPNIKVEGFEKTKKIVFKVKAN